MFGKKDPDTIQEEWEREEKQERREQRGEERIRKESGKLSDEDSINNYLSGGEREVWYGRPQRRAHIANAVFTMLPFALVWLLFDGTFIGMISTFASRMPKFVLIFLAVFFLFHLMPVWIWIGGIVKGFKEIKCNEYMLTDKRVIVRTGARGDMSSIAIHDISAVNITSGMIDRRHKVGDITVYGVGTTIKILDIDKPQEVFKMIENGRAEQASQENNN